METLRVQLSEDGADAERVDELTRHLRRELEGVDAAAEVVPAPSDAPAPEGSRAFDVLAVGTLLVSLIDAQGLVAVIGAAKAWLARGSNPQRTVRVEVDGDVLELTGASAHEQDRLVELFVSRHGPGGGTAWTAAAPP